MNTRPLVTATRKFTHSSRRLISCTDRPRSLAPIAPPAKIACPDPRRSRARRPTACSFAVSGSTTWKNAGVGSSVHSVVSDDAAFDARRSVRVKPPPRVFV